MPRVRAFSGLCQAVGPSELVLALDVRIRGCSRPPAPKNPEGSQHRVQTVCWQVS